jgi:hypothetical protein
VLNEQVTAANQKLEDMERTMTEKNQLLTNAEDLLQRVSQFALHVGIQIDKQKVPRFAYLKFIQRPLKLFSICIPHRKLHESYKKNNES